MERKAKIVATLGPSTQGDQKIRQLVIAGLDVARLNFSHGTHADHASRIASIRKISQELNKPIAILQDLQGPKLRVGRLPDAGIPLVKDQRVSLASVDASGNDNPPGDKRIIPMDVPDLTRSLVPGNRILLDDGQLELEVIEVSEDQIDAKVVLGGVLKSHKGVNLPGANLTIPGFTEKDEADLAFGLEQGIDWVAISFVKSKNDIDLVRNAIRRLSPNKTQPPIIAKLERPEAIVNLDEIIQSADGVMVARGDLGVETSPASVPIVQKRIIQEANRHNKVVITATQMLDSMIYNPRPTRAEASDVANAIFDGTDAVMLSGETASGNYPIESVQMMDYIAREAEQHYSEWGSQSIVTDDLNNDDAISMTLAARELAHDRNVSAIAVFTITGKTALLMSKARPRVPIFAFTPEEKTYSKMGLYWGVVPYYVPFDSTVEGMIAHVEAAILSASTIKPGQQVVVITGFPVGSHIPPNLALLHTIRG